MSFDIHDINSKVLDFLKRETIRTKKITGDTIYYKSFETRESSENFQKGIEKILAGKNTTISDYSNKIDGKIFPLFLEDFLCCPENCDTCISEEWNERFTNEENREETMQKFVEWLKDSFKEKMTNYFNDLDASYNPNFFYWFVRTYKKLNVVISLKDISKKAENLSIWSNSVFLEKKAISNLLQLILGIRDTFMYQNVNSNVFFYIFDTRDEKIKKYVDGLKGKDDIFVSETHLSTIDLCDIATNPRTVEYIKKRRYSNIPVMTYILINTYRHFMLTKLTPLERASIMILGGTLKSLWNITISTDVDYIVSENQWDELEKGSKYKVDIGVDGIFDDYGLSYYHDELVYYPENIKYYEIYQELKYEKYVEMEGNYTKCSSGLRIVRYFNIYKQLCNKLLKSNIPDFCHKIKELELSMDDVIYDNYFHMIIYGVKFIYLPLEFVRDVIKNIDLKKVSKKQATHFCVFKEKYEKTNFYENFIKDLDIERVTKGNLKSLINLDVNLYHNESELPYMKYVSLRHTSRDFCNKIKEQMKNIEIKSPPDEFSEEFDENVYENTYISCLPIFIKVKNDLLSVKWKCLVTEFGSMNVSPIYEGYTGCKDNKMCKKYYLKFIINFDEEDENKCYIETDDDFKTIMKIIRMHIKKDKISGIDSKKLKIIKQ